MQGSQDCRVFTLDHIFHAKWCAYKKACLRLCSGTSLLYLAMDQVHSISTYIILVQSGAFLCMFGRLPCKCWDMLRLLRSIIGIGAKFCSECLILAKFPGQVCPGQGSTGSTGSTLDNAALCCQPKNMREPAAQKRPRQLTTISCTRYTRCMAMTYNDISNSFLMLSFWCLSFANKMENTGEPGCWERKNRKNRDCLWRLGSLGSIIFVLFRPSWALV